MTESLQDRDPIALFDLDGSLADYEAGIRRYLSTLRSPDEPQITDDDSLRELEKLPYMNARIKLVKDVPGFWEYLPAIQKGLDVFTSARAIGYDCQVLTKGPRAHAAAWSEKLRWSQRIHGPDVDVHVTSDKGLVYGRVLYDDFPDYMERWLHNRPRGLGIMPVTPHNKAYSHPNVIRYDANLAQVVEALEIAYHRPTREALRLVR